MSNYLTQNDPKPDLTKLKAAYPRWQNYEASLSIIGSLEVETAFATQLDHHRRVLGSSEDMLEDITCMRDPNLSKSRQSRCRKSANRNRKEIGYTIYSPLRDARNEFVKFARRDLGQ